MFFKDIPLSVAFSPSSIFLFLSLLNLIIPKLRSSKVIVLNPFFNNLLLIPSNLPEQFLTSRTVEYIVPTSYISVLHDFQSCQAKLVC